MRVNFLLNDVKSLINLYDLIEDFFRGALSLLKIDIFKNSQEYLEQFEAELEPIHNVGGES